MKKRRVIIIIGIVVGICLLLFLLFKVGLFYVYKSSVSSLGEYLEEFVQGYSNSEEVSITKSEASEYLDFGDYKIGNYFKDFKEDDTDTGDFNVYYQYKDDEKVGMLSAGTFVSLVDVPSSDDITLFRGESDNESYFGDNDLYSRILYSGYQEYIERNNITNDAELIKSWSEYDFNQKFNIFTPIKTLREDFSIKTIVTIYFPTIDKIYYLDGDFEGYILEINSSKNNRTCYEINILENDKRYIFTILSSDYDFEDIKEIVSTIKIN